MGMSTHIQAFTPDTDAEYQKHKKVFLVCLEADISLPKETAEYFGTENPEEWALDEKLSVDLEEDVHYKEWSEDSSQGFELDLTKVPKGVTKIRFYNNW
jgi:hypothetical protein